MYSAVRDLASNVPADPYSVFCLSVRPPRPVTRINVRLKLYKNISPFQERELEKTEKFVVKCKSLCRSNLFPNYVMHFPSQSRKTHAWGKLKQALPLRNGKGKGKGKAIPLQAWTGAWGSSRLRLTEFIDNRHMKVARNVSLKYRPSLPSKDILGINFYYRTRPQGHSAPEGLCQ
jgi:hypothetical protein